MQRWDEGLQSCVDCPAGQERDDTNPTQCIAFVVVTVAEKPQYNKFTWLYITAPLVVSFGAICTVFVCCLVRRAHRNVRNTRYAPKGTHAAIIFTDVQMSTRLWGTVPASMACALDQHHAHIRAAIRAHSAYEVKTVGDSFMIACGTAQQAVALALLIETSFMSAAWPRCINLVYAADTVHGLCEAIEDDPSDLAKEGIDVNEAREYLRTFRLALGGRSGDGRDDYDDYANDQALSPTRSNAQRQGGGGGGVGGDAASDLVPGNNNPLISSEFNDHNTAMVPPWPLTGTLSNSLLSSTMAPLRPVSASTAAALVVVGFSRSVFTQTRSLRHRLLLPSATLSAAAHSRAAHRLLAMMRSFTQLTRTLLWMGMGMETEVMMPKMRPCLPPHSARRGRAAKAVSGSVLAAPPRPPPSPSSSPVSAS